MRTFRPIRDSAGRVIDLEVDRPEALPIKMLGPGGEARELAILSGPEAQRAGCLPVLLGAGMGHALRRLLDEAGQGPLPVAALVDKELELVRAAGIDTQDPRLLFISRQDPDAVLAELSGWQRQRDGLPFAPVVNPFYQRLDKPFYGYLREHLEASHRFDFWAKARQPRFRGDQPRLLLITSRYFLIGEVAEACRRLGIPCRMLTLENDEIASKDFITALLRLVLEFQPDAVLTLNHLGVDREGLLTDLLARLELPLASWFVDNPHLVLHLYEGLNSPWLAIFTWDKDNIPSLRAQGFNHVYHLPLGTAPERFRPRPGPVPAAWRAEVSFVGNSMLFKVGQRMKRAHLPRPLLLNYRQVAADFTASSRRSVRDFVQTYSPELAGAYDGLPDTEARLAYETMLTWEATRQYRQACVERLFDVGPSVHPLVVGDEGWKIAFKREKRRWRWHGPLAYYDELPGFYPLSEINFNTTSMQMKGAVNQRVFDVPAAGAFVLTDWREQMDELFEPGREIISYVNPGEVPELARYYLKHASARQKIALAGRQRVLACHTWDKRLRSLLQKLKEIFG